MHKQTFTFNPILTSIILLSTLSVQSMENKDNKRINLLASGLFENNTAAHTPNSTSTVNPTLMYAIGRHYGIIREGSNGDLLGYSENNFLSTQNSSQPTAHAQKYHDTHTFSAKTEAELLIHSDNHKLCDELPLYHAATIDDTEIFY